MSENRGKVLLVATSFGISYEVLRCAHLANMSVHILAADRASGLRFSRYCKSIHRFVFEPGYALIGDTAAEIVETARRVHADMVLPCDTTSTRLFSLIARQLPVPTCPLPLPPVFDTVNDKWRFYQLCRSAGLPTPETWLFEDVAALEQSFRNGTIEMPAIVKPHNLSGGAGIRIVRNEADIPQLRRIQYRPVIVQRFIAGCEDGINMICIDGDVAAWVYQRHLPDRIVYSKPEIIHALTRRLAEATHYQGIAHIDTIEDVNTGQISLIEFNPRFWSSVFPLALAGFNFVKISLEDLRKGGDSAATVSDRAAVMNKTLFKRLIAADKIHDKERVVLSRRSFDPLIMLGQRFRLLEDLTPSLVDNTLPRCIGDEAVATALLAPDQVTQTPLLS